MMRVAWRTSMLVAFCLLTSTVTAHAECAWVLWTEERRADGAPIKLSATDAFDTREQCRTRLAHTTALRPFHVNVPDAELTELRRRINATRWPEQETVGDASQGVQLATTQQLARYWATEYDWRKCEAKLNALANFTTEIDGLDIHFIHVRSKHDNALPLIVTHGWPGSII